MRKGRRQLSFPEGQGGLGVLLRSIETNHLD